MILPINLSRSSLSSSDSLYPSSLRLLAAKASSKSRTPHTLDDDELLLDYERISLELYFFIRGDTLGSYFWSFGGVWFSLFWMGVLKD
jgi:hypothetical protein